ncbi:MAG: hypothetical protein WCH05_10630, partial [Chlorobiaceae bacterium]
LVGNNGGTEAMTILNNGNVGIGQVAPGAKLSVSGGGAFGSSYSATAVADGNLIVSGNVGIGQVAPGAKLSVSGGGAFGSSYSATAVADGNLIVSGNVGIGTTGPLATLQVQRTQVGTTEPNGVNNGAVDAHTVLTLAGGGTVEGAKVGLQFVPYGGAYSIGGIFGLTTSTGGVNVEGDMTFDMRDSTDHSYLTEVMRITKSGNVGIGTTNPGAKLDVVGSQIQFSNPSGNGNPANNYSYLNATSTTVNTQTLTLGTTYGYDTPVNALSIYNGGVSIGSYAGTAAGNGNLIVSGNVGIGTTGPNEPLEVAAANNHGVRISSIGTEASPILSFYPNSANVANRNWAFVPYMNAVGDFAIRYSNAAGGNPATAGTTALEILNNGNVGIGQVAPGAKLSVSGGGAFGSSYSATAVADGNLIVSGNVGIGTSAPTNVFQVSSTANNTGGAGLNTALIASTQSNAVSFDAGASNANRINFITGAPASPSFDFQLYSDSGHGMQFIPGNGSSGFNPTAMTILSSGNVGIGTTAPGAKLDVKSINSSVQPLSIVTYNATTNTVGVSTSYGGLSMTNAVDSTFVIRSLGSGHMQLTTDSAGRYMSFATGLFQERMRIDASGNVGIGTTAPAKKLEIANSSADQLLRFTDTSVAHGMTTQVPTTTIGQIGDLSSLGGLLAQGYSSGDNESIRLEGTSGGTGTLVTPVVSFTAYKKTGTTRTAVTGSDLAYQFDAGTTPLVSIQGGGNVGIGTTNPGAKLESYMGATGYGAPVTSGITQTYGAFRVRAGGGVLDFGVLQNGNAWLQNGEATALGTNYNLLLQPNGGNVGIGTTNPASLLQIGTPFTANSVYDTATRIRVLGSTAQSATDEVLLRLNRGEQSGQFYPGTADFKLGSYGAGGAGDGYAPKTKLTIALKSTSNFNESGDVNVMTLLSSGNVGIGTTNPESSLTVSGTNIAGNATVPGIHMGLRAGIQPEMQFYGSNGTIIDFTNASGEDADWRMSANADNWTIGATTAQYGLAINTSGNVGIGTMSPAAMLNVYGASNALRLSYNASNYSTLSSASNGNLQFATSTTTESAIVVGDN